MGKKITYAVVTGASSGIGAEFARRLAKEGFSMILVARREERLRKLAEEMKCESIILAADLSKETECRRLVQELENKKVTVFINNAGFGECGKFLETDVDKEIRMIDVNVRAVHLLTKLMIRKMERQHGGYLLNVASAAGLMPAGPYMAAYYATKAYVASMTRAVSEELREQGSPVYLGCLCPGPVRTEFDRVANVEFSLNGISAAYCANYAVEEMKKKKRIIIPAFSIRAAVTLGRFFPQPLYIRAAAHQQRRKTQRNVAGHRR